MGSFFKSFGKGILYLFVLPFLLIILALYGIAGLFGFVFLFFKSIVLFFTGRSLNDDLPEDIEAKKRLYGVPEEQSDVSFEQVEEKKEEFHVYQPEVDPFSTRVANEDPYKPQTVEEGLWRSEPQKAPKVEETNIEETSEDLTQIESSLDDLLEEPKAEEVPLIEEPEINDSDYHQINTSDIDDTTKYVPRGSEELMSIDDDDEPFEEEDGVGVSFDDM